MDVAVPQAPYAGQRARLALFRGGYADPRRGAAGDPRGSWGALGEARPLRGGSAQEELLDGG